MRINLLKTAQGIAFLALVGIGVTAIESERHSENVYRNFKNKIDVNNDNFLDSNEWQKAYDYFGLGKYDILNSKPREDISNKEMKQYLKIK